MNRKSHLLPGLLMALVVLMNLLDSQPAQAHTDMATHRAAAPAVVVTGRVTLDGAGEPGVIVEAVSLFGNTVIATATTNAQGNFILDTGTSTVFRLRPRKGVYEFVPASVTVTSLNNAPANQSFAMRRPPIVIQGGYTPTGLPQNSCPQRRLNGTTYAPGACGELEFANLLAELRGAGWTVHTVMMNSSIFGTPRLSTQTSALRRTINEARAATGAAKAIVFAHSTGGPVVRRYLESTDYNHDISHFFTFGSQHMGNPVESIADIWFAQIMPEFLRRTGVVPNFVISALVSVIDATIRDKVNFLCSTSLFRFTIPFVGTFDVPGPGQTVLCETSISGMANFNQSFRPRAGVTYHLVHAANVRSGDMNALGRAMTFAIPGLDDTLIQTNSATGFLFGGPHDRLITRDPHMTMTSVGERYYLNTNGAFDSAYVLCIRPMFITRTLTAASCGSVTAAADVDDVSAVGEMDAATRFENTDGAAIEQKTALRTETLLDTTTLVTHTVHILEEGSATFLSSWSSGALSFTVVDAGGALVTPDTSRDDVEYYSDDIRAGYTFSATVPGAYTFQLQATVVPTTGVDIAYFAALDSQFTLTTGRSRNWMPPGESITITALFTGPMVIETPVVFASVSGSNDISATITLDDLGDGRYQTIYTAPLAPGYLVMDIVATGVVDGVPIERADSLAFTIYPDSFRPNHDYRVDVSREGLIVTAGISVTPGVDGDFRVTGILVDDAGNLVAVATSDGQAPPGASAVDIPLLFGAEALYAAESAGPFTLHRLLVVDERVHQQVSADEADVLVIEALDRNQFAPGRLHLPLLTR